MVLKRIGIASAAKIGGILYAVIGLIAGALLSLMSLMGAALGSGSELGGAEALFFGLGAIFFLPFFYGIMGAVFCAIGSAVYNVIASMTGGLQVELETEQIEAPPIGMG